MLGSLSARTRMSRGQRLANPDKTHANKLTILLELDAFVARGGVASFRRFESALVNVTNNKRPRGKV